MKKKKYSLRKKIALTILGLIVLLGLAEAGGTVFQGLGLDLGAIFPAIVAMLTNNARAKVNAPVLITDPLLTKAAQAKADDMAAKGYFAHVSPDGKLPWYWFDKAGYKYEYAGENLAVDFGESEKLVDAWMNSPTHKENILNPHYTQIGIGIAEGLYKGHQATFVVQFFASKPQK